VSDFNTEYDQLTSPLGTLGEILERLIKELLAANGVKPHAVASRVKSKESLNKKSTAATQNGRLNR
jgi:ppGpp synthetase/RelA/SpoT-type nucleotidyltranferase